MNGLRVGEKKSEENLKKEKSKASIADENLNVICSSYLSLSAIHVFDAFVVSLWLSPLLFDLTFQFFLVIGENSVSSECLSLLGTL